MWLWRTPSVFRNRWSFNPHTHAGCDLNWYSHIQLSVSFNPHTHAGCDWYGIVPCAWQAVSIHTPTQGVTLHSISTWLSPLFQSTHPRRVWRLQPGARCPHSVFQSTHPRRVWLGKAAKFLCGNGFNPHTHAGCDLEFLTVGDYGKFQSTHPRRVWPLLGLIFHPMMSFNPHTHAGCDPTSKGIRKIHSCFNPHTHAGCDFSFTLQR